MNLILPTEENKTKMTAVSEALLGSCDDLEEVLQFHFGEGNNDITMFDQKLLLQLDDFTLKCEECGWWCETGEMNEDSQCEDCAPKEDDDE